MPGGTKLARRRPCCGAFCRVSWAARGSSTASRASALAFSGFDPRAGAVTFRRVVFAGGRDIPGDGFKAEKLDDFFLLAHPRPAERQARPSAGGGGADPRPPGGLQRKYQGRVE